MNTIVIDDLKTTKVSPSFSVNNVPLCLFSSNEYAPYCGVVINSVVLNGTPDNNYDIIVLERNISDNNKRLMLSLIENRSNFSIRFVNTGNISDLLSVKSYGYYSLESCLKIFLMSSIFEEYDKMIVTDSDLIFNSDIANLYNVDIGKNYMGAVDDIIMKYLVAIKHNSMGTINVPRIPAGEYLTKHLGFDSEYDCYYNTGVIALNLRECRKHDLFDTALNILQEKEFWFLEQDLLNILCYKNTYGIDCRWNVQQNAIPLFEKMQGLVSDDLIKLYQDSYENFYILHYAGGKKPWNLPSLEMADFFYKYARSSPWYERIVYNYSNRPQQNRQISNLENVERNHYNEINRFAWKICIKSFGKSILNGVLSLRYRKNPERQKFVYSQIRRWSDSNYKFARKAMKQRFRKGFLNKLFHLSKPEYDYDKIKKLKNKYKGQRCFIVGTGPSLTLEMVEALKNEVTFSLNSIYKLFDETDWRPTFYVQNDIMISYGVALRQKVRWDELKNWLGNYEMNNLIFSSSTYNRNILDLAKGECYFVPTEDSLYQLIRKDPPKFGIDCSRRLYAYGTTVYLITQLAAYMGFSEIYLLGTDANYTLEKAHVYKEDDSTKNLYGNKTRAESLSKGLLLGFNAIKIHNDKKKFADIYNCTPGGNLEYFPRVSLDAVLQNKNLSEERKILVSIVVPIYNSQQYLKRCMDSLVNQTFASLEVIAVNNGSTDNSLKILETYAKKFGNKVKVITIDHREYAGAGRNIGIAEAKGKYIAFCDSDDSMPLDAIENMYKVAEERKAELTVCPHMVICGRERSVRNVQKILVNGNIKEYTTKIEPAPWAKLFLREFIEKVGGMPEDFCFEDLAWYLKYITYVENAAYCQSIGYYYYQRSNSQVHTVQSERILDTMKAEQYGIDNCNSYYKEYIEYYVASRIRFNLNNRPYFTDRWLEYLSGKWDTLSQNRYFMEDTELKRFLEIRLENYRKEKQ